MSMQSFNEITADMFPEQAPAAADSGGVRSARRRNQDAEWRRELSRAYGYQIGRARSDDERAAIDAEYQRRLAAGPDFMRYRRGSDFRDAPRLSIDRNAVARIRVMLQCIRRGTWREKDKGRHHGGVPHSAIEVFDALVMLYQKHGRVFPSLVGLAFLSTRSKQTVVNALKLLEFYGFVTVHRRIKRIRTALGLKTVQDTNAYVIQEPNVLARVAFAKFRQGSESRNQAARRPEAYISNPHQVITPPWGIPDGVFASSG